jgi:hypothetical protein
MQQLKMDMMELHGTQLRPLREMKEASNLMDSGLCGEMMMLPQKLMLSALNQAQ